MANGLNQCTFCGNLGADPELRVTKSGKSVLNFRMACSEARKQPDGSWGEHTEWVSIVVWGNRAEGLGKFLAKRHTVVVQGKMRTTSYDDKEGNKRYKTEIHADEVIVAGGGGERGGRRENSSKDEPRRAQRRPQGQQQDDKPSSSNAYPDSDYGPTEDDDIRF